MAKGDVIQGSLLGIILLLSLSTNLALEVSNVIPTEGSSAGGTLLTIRGKGFSFPGNLNKVLIGASDVPQRECTPLPYYCNEETIVCETPPGPWLSRQPIHVFDRFGEKAACTSECTYRFNPRDIPVIERLSPEAGTPGTILYIHGQNFPNTELDRMTIKLGHYVLPSGLSQNSRDTIISSIPNIAAGDYRLSIIFASTGKAHAPADVTFRVLPAITSISPRLVGIFGGNLVTVRGSAFDSRVSHNVITMNKRRAEIKSVSEDTIVFRVPFFEETPTLSELRVDDVAVRLIIPLPPLKRHAQPRLRTIDDLMREAQDEVYAISDHTSTTFSLAESDLRSCSYCGAVSTASFISKGSEPIMLSGFCIGSCRVIITTINGQTILEQDVNEDDATTIIAHVEANIVYSVSIVFFKENEDGASYSFASSQNKADVRFFNHKLIIDVDVNGLRVSCGLQDSNCMLAPSNASTTVASITAPSLRDGVYNGDYGFLVTLSQGPYLDDELFLEVGSTKVAGEKVGTGAFEFSSELLRSIRYRGLVKVQMSLNGEAFVTPPLDLWISPKIYNVSPSRTGNRGGALITLQGEGLRESREQNVTSVIGEDCFSESSYVALCRAKSSVAPMEIVNASLSLFPQLKTGTVVPTVFVGVGAVPTPVIDAILPSVVESGQGKLLTISGDSFPSSINDVFVSVADQRCAVKSAKSVLLVVDCGRALPSGTHQVLLQCEIGGRRVQAVGNSIDQLVVRAVAQLSQARVTSIFGGSVQALLVKGLQAMHSVRLLYSGDDVVIENVIPSDDDSSILKFRTPAQLSSITRYAAFVDFAYSLASEAFQSSFSTYVSEGVVIVDSVLDAHVQASRGSTLLFNERVSRPVELEARVRFEEKRGLSIAFVADPLSPVGGYFLDIVEEDADPHVEKAASLKVRLEKRGDEELQMTASVPKKESGAWYSITLKIMATEVLVYIDGELTVYLKDGHFITGYLGFLETESAFDLTSIVVSFPNDVQLFVNGVQASLNGSAIMSFNETVSPVLFSGAINGSDVTIVGKFPSSNYTVRVGSQACDVIQLSRSFPDVVGQVLSCVLEKPNEFVAGAHAVSVNSTLFGSSSNNLTLSISPSIHRVSPSVLLPGGAVVTIFGDYFPSTCASANVLIAGREGVCRVKSCDRLKITCEIGPIYVREGPEEVCPRECSGNGICNADARQCVCGPSYCGLDCSGTLRQDSNGGYLCEGAVTDFPFLSLPLTTHSKHHYANGTGNNSSTPPSLCLDDRCSDVEGIAVDVVILQGSTVFEINSPVPLSFRSTGGPEIRLVEPFMSQEDFPIALFGEFPEVDISTVVVLVGRGGYCDVTALNRTSLVCTLRRVSAGVSVIEVFFNGVKAYGSDWSIPKVSIIPSFREIQPTSGASTGGSVLTVFGSSFIFEGSSSETEAVEEHIEVLVGEDTCTIVSVELSKITCRTPPAREVGVSVHVSVFMNMTLLSQVTHEGGHWNETGSLLQNSTLQNGTSDSNRTEEVPDDLHIDFEILCLNCTFVYDERLVPQILGPGVVRTGATSRQAVVVFPFSISAQAPERLRSRASLLDSVGRSCTGEAVGASEDAGYVSLVCDMSINLRYLFDNATISIDALGASSLYSSLLARATITDVYPTKLSKFGGATVTLVGDAFALAENIDVKIGEEEERRLSAKIWNNSIATVDIPYQSDPAASWTLIVTGNDHVLDCSGCTLSSDENISSFISTINGVVDNAKAYIGDNITVSGYFPALVGVEIVLLINKSGHDFHVLLSAEGESAASFMVPVMPPGVYDVVLRSPFGSYVVNSGLVAGAVVEKVSYIALSVEGGGIVEVSGSGFLASRDMIAANIGGREADIMFSNATFVALRVPRGLSGGSQNLTLSVNEIDAHVPNGVNTLPLSSTATPVVSFINATVVTEGDIIELTGMKFSTSTVFVTVGTADCSVIEHRDDLLTCRIGHGRSGTFALVVDVSPIGYAESSVFLTYVSRVDAVSPSVLDLNNGALLIIGAGLTLATTITINDYELRCEEPAEAWEPFSALVCNVMEPISFVEATASTVIRVESSEDALSTNSLHFTFDSALNPRLDSITPEVASSNRQTVFVISGSNFGKNATVLLGNLSLVPDIINDTVITVSCPAGQVGTLEVKVLSQENGVSQGTLAVSFHFDVVSVSPSYGSIAGGSILTLRGQGLDVDRAALVVHMGEHYSCDVVETSEEYVLCRVIKRHRQSQKESMQLLTRNAQLEDSAVSIIVVAVGKQQAECTGDCSFTFAVNATPIVTQVSQTASMTGTVLTVRGSGLDGATVSLGPYALPTLPSGSDDDTRIARLSSVRPGTYKVRVHVEGLGDAFHLASCPEGTFLDCQGHCRDTRQCVSELRFSDCEEALAASLRREQKVDTKLFETFSCPMYGCDGSSCLDDPGFAVTVQARLQNVSPSISSIEGGNVITLTGESFSTNKSLIAVQILNNSCHVLEANFTTIICQTSKSDDVKAGSVVVTIGGHSALHRCDKECTLLYTADIPVIDRAQQQKVRENTMLTVTGSRLQAVSSLFIGTDLCEIVRRDDDSLSCVVREMEGGVYSLAGHAEDLGSIHVNASLRIEYESWISGVFPSVGSIFGRQTVTITGGGFVSGETEVFLGVVSEKTRCLSVAQSRSQIICSTPRSRGVGDEVVPLIATRRGSVIASYPQSQSSSFSAIIYSFLPTITEQSMSYAELKELLTNGSAANSAWRTVDTVAHNAVSASCDRCLLHLIVGAEYWNDGRQQLTSITATEQEACTLFLFDKERETLTVSQSETLMLSHIPRGTSIVALPAHPYYRGRCSLTFVYNGSSNADRIEKDHNNGVGYFYSVSETPIIESLSLSLLPAKANVTIDVTVSRIDANDADEAFFAVDGVETEVLSFDHSTSSNESLGMMNATLLLPVSSLSLGYHSLSYHSSSSGDDSGETGFVIYSSPRDIMPKRGSIAGGTTVAVMVDDNTKLDSSHKYLLITGNASGPASLSSTGSDNRIITGPSPSGNGGGFHVGIALTGSYDALSFAIEDDSVVMGQRFLTPHLTSVDQSSTSGSATLFEEGALPSSTRMEKEPWWQACLTDVELLYANTIQLVVEIENDEGREGKAWVTFFDGRSNSFSSDLKIEQQCSVEIGSGTAVLTPKCQQRCLRVQTEGLAQLTMKDVSIGVSVATSDSVFFEYDEALTPSVLRVTPSRGSTAGGTALTIFGSRFSPSSSSGSVSVHIDGVSCDNVEVRSDSELVCTTSPHMFTRVSAVRVVVDGKGAAVNHNASFQYIDLWSSTTTWGGQPPPREGETVYVPPGQVLMLDVDSPRLHLVLVEGTLMFDPAKDVSIRAKYIFVFGGAVEVGREGDPYTRKAVIELYGGPEDIEIPIYGAKVMALRGGRIDMHGLPKTPWTRLSPLGETEERRADRLVLDGAVEGWQREDVLVVTSNGFDFEEEELCVIDSISIEGNRTIIQLTANLSVLPKCLSSPGLARPLCPEVASLSRNIVFRGDASTSQTGFGAHLFMMPNVDMTKGDDASNNYARVENVEFYDVGQEFQLGRYPIHFHLAGSLRHSYAKGNSIRRSFNRAVAIHGVHGLTVEENVAFDVKGHSFFVEDGIETNNIIRKNVAIRTRESNSLLNVDTTPAGFWVTNPANILEGNVATGSKSYGFWYSPFDHPQGPSFDPSICPRSVPILRFNDNVAHSNQKYGLRVFPVYRPTTGEGDCSKGGQDTEAEMTAFTSYRNRLHGASVGDTSFVGNVGALVFSGSTFAENGQSEYWSEEIFDNLAAGVFQGIRNSRFIASFDNPLPFGGSSRLGISLPFSSSVFCSDNTFFGYGSKGEWAIGAQWASSGSLWPPFGFETALEGNSFVNSTQSLRLRFEFMASYLDVDGSITGRSGSRVVFPSALYDPIACPVRADLYGYAVCSPSYPVRRIHLTTRYGQFGTVGIRTSRAEINWPCLECWKFGYVMIAPMNETFEIDFRTTRVPSYQRWSVDMAHAQQGSSLQSEKYLLTVFYPEVQAYISVEPSLERLAFRPELSDSTMGYFYNCSIEGHPVFGSYLPEGTVLRNCSTADKTLTALVNPYETQTVTIRSSVCPPEPPIADPFDLDDIDCYPFSESETWNKTGLRRPETDDDFTVPEGVHLCLDISPPRLGSITLFGALTIMNTTASHVPIIVKAESVVISGGALRVGTAEQPYSGTVVFSLRRKPDVLSLVTKSILMTAGQLEFHGKQRIRAHTTLEEDIVAGARELKLVGNVDWQPGSIIGISTSTFLTSQTEFAVVENVSTDGRTMYLKNGVSHSHMIDTVSSSGKTMTQEVYVVLLSSNIMIESEADSSGLSAFGESQSGETFGCIVQVGCSGDAECPTSKEMGRRDGIFGRVRISNVELSGCGRMGSSPAFTIRGLRGVDDTASDSYVTNMFVRDALSGGLLVEETSKLIVNGTNVVGAKSFGVKVTSAENRLHHIIALHTVFPADPACRFSNNASDEHSVWTRYPGDQCKVVGIQVTKGNDLGTLVAVGSDHTAVEYGGTACRNDSTQELVVGMSSPICVRVVPSSLSAEGKLNSTRKYLVIGVITTNSGCSATYHVRAALCRDYGYLASYPVGSLFIENLRVKDAGIGALANVNAGGKTKRVVISYKDYFFTAFSPQIGCRVGLERMSAWVNPAVWETPNVIEEMPFKSSTWEQQMVKRNGVRYGAPIGLLQSSFVQDGKGGEPPHHDFAEIVNYPSYVGKVNIEDVVLSEGMQSCDRSTGFAQNLMSLDYFPLHEFRQYQFGAPLYMQRFIFFGHDRFDPAFDTVIPDARFNSLILDKDATLVSGLDEFAHLNERIVSNASMTHYLPSSFVQTSAACDFKPPFNVYLCRSQVRYDTLAIENRDQLARKIRLAPVFVCKEDWNGYGIDSSGFCYGTSTNVLSGVTYHGKSDKAVLERPGEFFSTMEYDGEYSLKFSSSMPKHLRFVLSNAGQDDFVILNLRYKTPNRVAIYLDRVKQPYISTNNIKAELLPNSSSPAGYGYLARADRFLSLIVRGETAVEVVVEQILQISLTLEMTIEEFFATGGTTTFLQRMSLLLDIDPSTIRIVDVRAGSTVIDFEIDGGNVAQNSTEADGGIIVNDLSEFFAELESKFVSLANAGEIARVLSTQILAVTIVSPPPRDAPDSNSSQSEPTSFVPPPYVPPVEEEELPPPPPTPAPEPAFESPLPLIVGSIAGGVIAAAIVGIVIATSLRARRMSRVASLHVRPLARQGSSEDSDTPLMALERTEGEAKSVDADAKVVRFLHIAGDGVEMDEDDGRRDDGDVNTMEDNALESYTPSVWAVTEWITDVFDEVGNTCEFAQDEAQVNRLEHREVDGKSTEDEEREGPEGNSRNENEGVWSASSSRRRSPGPALTISSVRPSILPLDLLDRATASPRPTPRAAPMSARSHGAPIRGDPFIKTTGDRRRESEGTRSPESKEAESPSSRQIPRESRDPLVYMSEDRVAYLARLRSSQKLKQTDSYQKLFGDSGRVRN